ncbi:MULTISPECIES: DUF6644 family protein [Devosia]|uniref:DUF6644 family protein n=1 Tax=Devosia TaxID=46913 RepID=UPI000CE95BCE|nr:MULTISPECIES: DUF6644 family protein [Devosia]AVF05025.1 DUF2214 domain-containing protein [Devosia sp. I507]
MWDALQSWPGAVALRGSPVLYLLVNAAHILGIGLIVGPILALDARLLGLVRHIPIGVVGPFLAAVAKLGVGLAIVTGLGLFSVQPANYAGNPAFLLKLLILVLAIANAVSVDRGRAWKQAIETNEIAAVLRWQAAASSMLWITVLVAGRWIGFV